MDHDHHEENETMDDERNDGENSLRVSGANDASANPKVSNGSEKENRMESYSDDSTTENGDIIADGVSGVATFRTEHFEVKVPFENATVRTADGSAADLAERTSCNLPKSGSGSNANRNSERSGGYHGTRTATIVVKNYEYELKFGEPELRRLQNSLAVKSDCDDKFSICNGMQWGERHYICEFSIPTEKAKEICDVTRLSLRQNTGSLVERPHENALWADENGFFTKSIKHDKDEAKPRFPTNISTSKKSINEAMYYHSMLDWACTYLHVKKLLDEGHAEVYDEERWNEVHHKGARLEEMVEQKHPDFPHALKDDYVAGVVRGRLEAFWYLMGKPRPILHSSWGVRPRASKPSPQSGETCSGERRQKGNLH